MDFTNSDQARWARTLRNKRDDQMQSAGETKKPECGMRYPDHEELLAKMRELAPALEKSAAPAKPDTKSDGPVAPGIKVCDICGRPRYNDSQVRHPKCIDMLPSYERLAQKPLSAGRFHANGTRFSVQGNGRVFIADNVKPGKKVHYRQTHAGYARHYYLRMSEEEQQKGESK